MVCKELCKMDTGVGELCSSCVAILCAERQRASKSVFSEEELKRIEEFLEKNKDLMDDLAKLEEAEKENANS